MSKIVCFSFENEQIRTVGTESTPLFIANDVAKALGFQKPANAVSLHVDPEDLIKVSIVDSLGRTQIANAVNESGLYALIFGSKLESAKRFKRWVTSEVLPAIRKTGQYQTSPEYITTEEQYQIRQAVKARAKVTPIHYQSLYNALYAQFQIPSYKNLRRSQFQEALDFIAEYDLKPQALPEQNTKTEYIRIRKDFLDHLQAFVYYWQYLFRDELDTYIQFLRMVKSPRAALCWDAVHNLNLAFVENELKRIGYNVKDLDCYRAWEAKQGKHLAA